MRWPAVKGNSTAKHPEFAGLCNCTTRRSSRTDVYKYNGYRNRFGIRLATLHANAKEEAQALLQNVQNRLDVVEVLHSEVSPVIGTHVGPGTVGLAYSYD